MSVLGVFRVSRLCRGDMHAHQELCKHHRLQEEGDVQGHGVAINPLDHSQEHEHGRVHCPPGAGLQLGPALVNNPFGDGLGVSLSPLPGPLHLCPHSTGVWVHQWAALWEGKGGVGVPWEAQGLPVPVDWPNGQLAVVGHCPLPPLPAHAHAAHQLASWLAGSNTSTMPTTPAHLDRMALMELSTGGGNWRAVSTASTLASDTRTTCELGVWACTTPPFTRKHFSSGSTARE